MKIGLKRQGFFFVAAISSTLLIANAVYTQVRDDGQGSSAASAQIVGSEPTAKGTLIRYSDGKTKEVRLDDDVIDIVTLPGGTAIDTLRNGTTVVTWPDKSGYIRYPDGNGAKMLSDGDILRVSGNIEILPDGSVVIVNKYGNRREISPVGTETSTNTDGTIFTDHPVGVVMTTKKQKDGTTTTFRRGGTVFIQHSDGRTEEMSGADYGARYGHSGIRPMFPNADPAPAITLPDTTKIIWFGDGKGVTIAPDGIVFPLYCPPAPQGGTAEETRPLDTTQLRRLESITLPSTRRGVGSLTVGSGFIPYCPPPIFQAIQTDDANQAGTPRGSADPVQKVEEKKPSSIYDNPLGFGGTIGGGFDIFRRKSDDRPGTPWDIPPKKK